MPITSAYDGAEGRTAPARFCGDTQGMGPVSVMGFAELSGPQRVVLRTLLHAERSLTAQDVADTLCWETGQVAAVLRKLAAMDLVSAVEVASKGGPPRKAFRAHASVDRGAEVASMSPALSPGMG